MFWIFKLVNQEIIFFFNAFLQCICINVCILIDGYKDSSEFLQRYRLEVHMSNESSSSLVTLPDIF